MFFSEENYTMDILQESKPTITRAELNQVYPWGGEDLEMIRKVILLHV